MKCSQIILVALAFSAFGCHASSQDAAATAAAEVDQVIAEALKAVDEAERVNDDATLQNSRKINALEADNPTTFVDRWPTTSDRETYAWGKSALVFELPQGAAFELLLASGDFPACGINAQQAGGLATFRRGSQVAEYGCWWSFQREADGAAWVSLEMEGGIQFRLPLRAFSKRPAL